MNRIKRTREKIEEYVLEGILPGVEWLETVIKGLRLEPFDLMLPLESLIEILLLHRILNFSVKVLNDSRKKYFIEKVSATNLIEHIRVLGCCIQIVE